MSMGDTLQYAQKKLGSFSAFQYMALKSMSTHTIKVVRHIK